MTNLFSKIEDALNQIQHGWTSPPKAFALASAIYALRPQISVEIGVYAGKGLISMALAHAELNHGHVIGIDPYEKAASVEGQVNPDDQKFWSNMDHDWAYQLATTNIERFGVKERVKLVRKRSDDVEPPENIGVLRIDGNHSEQALKDAERFAPNCLIGAILHLDDISWSGGGVMLAASYLVERGWREINRLDDAVVFQRIT